jgi:hypothetical protein
MIPFGQSTVDPVVAPVAAMKLFTVCGASFPQRLLPAHE